MSAGLFEESLERLLAERCGPEVRQRAEESGWAGELWATLEGSGYTQLAVGEASGGAGASFMDAVVLCRLAGRHAVPLPLAECSLLGGWLLDRAGFPLPAGPLTVAVPHPGDCLRLDREARGGLLRGTLGRVPFGRSATHLIALVATKGGPAAVLVECSSATITPGANLAGEARDRLTFTDVAVPDDHVVELAPASAVELEMRGALSRALLIAGAAETVATMTLAYSAARSQFGRPISSFQAVANRLVCLVAEAELAGVAAIGAATAFEAAGEEAVFEVAAAKATAARAAGEVAAHAHQVHAAIGMTQDYPLHHFTRRLWCWRQEWGSERSWAARLGGLVAAIGAEALWPRLTGGPPNGADPGA